MSDIFEKLGSYQILTNLLPGVFFAFILKFFLELTLPIQNVGEGMAVYYFLGFIINRVGSLVVEPILKKVNFIKYAPYTSYIKAVEEDSKIDTLSEMNNYTRSILTCVLLFPIIHMLQRLSFKWKWFSLNWKWGFIVFLVVLFLFSYRKQIDYVRKRIEAVNSQRE